MIKTPALLSGPPPPGLINQSLVAGSFHRFCCAVQIISELLAVVQQGAMLFWFEGGPQVTVYELFVTVACTCPVEKNIFINRGQTAPSVGEEKNCSCAGW